MSPEELFERYLYLGMARDADAQAELYADDGVLEMPLAAEGTPMRLEGRESIRDYLRELHTQPPVPGQVLDLARTRYVLHTTVDPDVFIAEIDAGMTTDGVPSTVSLVHIYRIKDGKLSQVRDYYR